MKKLFNLLYVNLLFIPMSVMAFNLGNMDVVDSYTDNIPDYEDVTYEDGVFTFSSNYGIYLYDEDFVEIGSYESDDYIDFDKYDNCYYVYDYYSITKLDSELNTLKKYNSDEYINNSFVYRDAIYLYFEDNDYSNDIYNIEIIKLDLNLNFVDSVSIGNLSSNPYLFYDKEFDKLFLELDDGYTYTLNEDLSTTIFDQFEPKIELYSSSLNKLDNKGLVVDSVNFKDSIREYTSAKYYKKNDKYYVMAISCDEGNHWQNRTNYILHFYVVDSDLNILDEKIVESSKPTSSYYYDDINDLEFIMNGNNEIYLYDTEIFSDKYYRLGEDLTLTEISLDEYVEENDSVKIEYYLRSLNKGDFYYRYYIDEEKGNFYVNVEWEDYSRDLIYFNSNYEKIFIYNIHEGYDWEDENDNKFLPDELIDESCVSKRIDTYVYKDGDYFIIAGNSAFDSFIKVIDEEGNLVEDYSDELISPFLTFKNIFKIDNKLYLYLSENFHIGCPTSSKKSELVAAKGKKDYIPVQQVLVLEELYKVNTVTNKGGSILATKDNVYGGNEVTFEVIPEIGYKLKEVKVTDSSGKTIVFTNYKFTMPNSDVIIEAIFEVDNPNTAATSMLLISLFMVISVFAYMKHKKKIEWLNQ